MSLPQSLATLASGVAVGFTVAAPVGPMGILCIQRTLASGAAAGLATGLGAATVHLAYSALAVVGLGTLVESFAAANSSLLSALSGGTLVWFAMRMRRPPVDVHVTSQPGRVRWLSAYASAIGLAIANPLTIILFCAALHTLIAPSVGLLLIAGVFIGSATWWAMLSTAIAAARSRIDGSILALSGQLASLVLFGLGSFALAKACGQIIK